MQPERAGRYFAEHDHGIITERIRGDIRRSSH
jgi:hypothetical protein